MTGKDPKGEKTSGGGRLGGTHRVRHRRSRTKVRSPTTGPKDLDRYFPVRDRSPGIVMLKFHAKSIRFRDGNDEGQITA